MLEGQDGSEAKSARHLCRYVCSDRGLVSRLGLGLELGDACERVAQQLLATSDRDLELGDAREGLCVLGVRELRVRGLRVLCGLRMLPLEICMQRFEVMWPVCCDRVACVKEIDDVFEPNEPRPRIVVESILIPHIRISTIKEITHCGQS